MQQATIEHRSWIGTTPKIDLGQNDLLMVRFGHFPWRIFINTGVTGDDLVSERYPAEFKLGRTLQGEESLGVWIHESVPKYLIPVVAYHEVVEAELHFVHEVPLEIAHRVACSLERTYARAILSDAQWNDYQQYRRTLTDGSHSLQQIIAARQKGQPN